MKTCYDRWPLYEIFNMDGYLWASVRDVRDCFHDWSLVYYKLHFMARLNFGSWPLNFEKPLNIFNKIKFDNFRIIMISFFLFRLIDDWLICSLINLTENFPINQILCCFFLSWHILIILMWKGGADIAIVRLQTPITSFTERIRPACLPKVSGIGLVLLDWVCLF